MLELGKFIVKFIENSWELVIPIKVCDEGCVLVRKCLGNPKEYMGAGLHWKIPFIQEFDEVDMRNKTYQGTAHSFKTKPKLMNLFPANELIDYIVVCRVVNPYIFYHFDEDNIDHLLDEKIHNIINDLHRTNKDKLNYETINKLLRESISTINKEFNGVYNSPSNTKSSNILEFIKIESISITSFDYNLSHRTTI